MLGHVVVGEGRKWRLLIVRAWPAQLTISVRDLWKTSGNPANAHLNLCPGYCCRPVPDGDYVNIIPSQMWIRKLSASSTCEFAFFCESTPRTRTGAAWSSHFQLRIRIYNCEFAFKCEFAFPKSCSCEFAFVWSANFCEFVCLNVNCEFAFAFAKIRIRIFDVNKQLHSTVLLVYLPCLAPQLPNRATWLDRATVTCFINLLGILGKLGSSILFWTSYWRGPF